MLLISRRRRPMGVAEGNGYGRPALVFDPGSPRAGRVPAVLRAWRRLDGRRTAMAVAAATPVVIVPLLVVGAGGPLGLAASFGGQLVLVSLAGAGWWHWRWRRDRVLAGLVIGCCAAWVVSTVAMGLALASPAHLVAYMWVVWAASPASSLLGLLVMAWLCRGRGRRLSLVRVGQGAGLVTLVVAWCWVLLLGSGQVIADLAIPNRAVAVGYLCSYLVSLCLGWYALFRRRRVGIPGLGLIYLSHVVGSGTTALLAVRTLAGEHTFGTPIELGWVVSAALVLAAAASNRIPSEPWERNRQRMGLIGVLLLVAGSMALGVAGFFDQATAGLQLQHRQGEHLHAAFDRVHVLTTLVRRGGTIGAAGGRDTAGADPSVLRMHADVVRGHLRAATDLARQRGAGRQELAGLEGPARDLDAYAAMALADLAGGSTARTEEQGWRLLGSLWAAAKDSDRRQEAGIGEMRRVGGLLQLAVPLGLLVAGLTFMSLWTTVAKRERLFEDAVARTKLTKAVVRAQERERGRIAADLHDGPLQQVATWRIKVEMILRKLDRDPPQARELLASLDHEIGQQGVELRRLMHALRPPVLDELGLEAAAAVLARDTSVRSGVEIRVDAGLDGLRCTPEVETLAYRIVQEGLTNVAKHAAATEAVVTVRAVDGGLLIRIADNGRGMREFEPEQLVRGGHFGLIGIDERVEIAGGRLKLVTGGEGTTLEAWLPASREEEPAASAAPAARS